MTQRLESGHGGPITDQRRIRAHNLAAVAQYVRARRSCSRGDIGTALDLNKATVSSLVGELIECGLLENGDPIPGTGAGRPSMTVQVDSTHHASIVVEIFPEHVRVSAWSLSLNNLSDNNIEVSPESLGADRTMSLTGTAVADAIAGLEADGRAVTGVVVAVPGAINPESGVVTRSRPLNWSNVAVRDQLISHVGRDDLEFHVTRPAALATIAEWTSLPGYQNMLCVQAAEHGIGTGIVADGTLMRGGHGHAGVVIDQGQLGLNEILRIRHGRTIDDLAALLAAGDPDVTAVVDDFTTAFVNWLVPVVALLDTSAVILAGYLQILGPYLHPRITEALVNAALYSPGADVEVRLGVHGAGAFRVGGAIMLADHTFDRAKAATNA